VISPNPLFINTHSAQPTSQPGQHTLLSSALWSYVCVCCMRRSNLISLCRALQKRCGDGVGGGHSFAKTALIINFFPLSCDVMKGLKYIIYVAGVCLAVCVFSFHCALISTDIQSGRRANTVSIGPDDSSIHADCQWMSPLATHVVARKV